MDENNRKEIKEAIKACDKVIGLLNKTRRALNSAQGLGIWDLLGGKKFVTFIKRLKIRNAEKHLAQAKRAIKVLNQEIQDVEQIVNINFDMGIVLTLADYFFGGAIADWIVLGKLGEAKLKVEKAKMQVYDIKVELESLL